MRKLLLVILSITSITTSFAQPKAEEPSIHDHKYYFPSSLYDDSVSFNKAIPSLAEKVIADFSEKEKRILKNLPVIISWQRIITK
jgi:hypothetical protein